ncbi:Taurine catabolism dioxygenase TauD/TfdA [Parafrankia sp. EAN1pec]|uniref:TauD/TfdA dioxygenase family protein n=1 Tax=Parafrankia sp. (strain EAN1pec) TaxID=298653 RepID=UPI00005420E8|nr:Taurine catabolism dioxygenase TauD/TfdA [Frankia sp. EAN1pec]
MSTTATPLSAHVGLEITGVCGRDLPTPSAAADCLKALEQYGVVVYREAHIGDQELVAFSRLLGEVAPNPTGEHQFPEIATITLDPAKTDAVRAWYRQGNFLWHIDGATEELPQKATLLTAREVDPKGGDTEFASTYAAYDALPEEEKERLAGLRVVHSFAAAQQRAHPEATEDQRAAWARVPVREHPLVWTRRTGRRSLLLGATAGEVIGIPADEGQALLKRLLDWSTQPRFVLRHRWRLGDLVIWDNTGMLHRATPFAATSRRLMHRTTLVGEVAVA